jgi:outer membrane protein TolC
VALPAAGVFAFAILVVASANLAAQASASGGLSLLDAARTALAEQPLIGLSREQVTIARGVLQSASGRFDVGFTSTVDRTRSTTPLRQQEIGTSPTSTLLNNQTRVTFGLEKPLRSGLLISPFVEIARQDVNLDPTATNRASVGVALIQPLVRGRGVAIVTAHETAARYDVDASTRDLRHNASTAVLHTAVAYWNYVAAAHNLEIVVAAEARARRLVSEVQTLIGAGNRPAADLRQANGNLAERIAQRTSYEQALFEARQSLGLAMGIAADRITALPLPVDPFPAIASVLPETGDARLVALALERRADLDAVRQRTLSTQSLQTVARDGLRSQVDLNVHVGYAGLAEGGSFPGLFASLQERVAGPDIAATVSIARSHANNTARGQLAQADAAVRQTALRIDDLTRQIRSGVDVAGNDLARSAQRVRLLRDAASAYDAAVTDERDKLQIGLSTIIDLISIEDRLTRSLLDEVAARLGYATALARLRFETGTLIDGATPDFQVLADAFITVPSGGGR